MFCYQAAALRRSEGLASVITFGSPVDIHRNLPRVHETAAGQLIRAARQLARRPLEAAPGLPGFRCQNNLKNELFD
jgi:putative long chain acyl-CoA synthase